ncbi:UNVERIFIED_CONTAM: hypothetical protein FKN15_006115 [Acipenser sinensis]
MAAQSITAPVDSAQGEWAPQALKGYCWFIVVIYDYVPGYSSNCYEVGHCAELAFAVEPSDIIAVQEQPLMLHCQVDGIQPITTSWRRNGVLLLDGENNAMFVNGSLVITRFQKTKADGSSDEGDYDCVAQNHFGLVVSRKAKVQAASKSSLSWQKLLYTQCSTHLTIIKQRLPRIPNRY